MSGIMRKRRTCLTHDACYRVGVLEVGGEKQAVSKSVNAGTISKSSREKEEALLSKLES